MFGGVLTPRLMLTRNESHGMAPEIAEISAMLRTNYALRTPDSIQLATAINRGTSSFLANDRRLSVIPDLEIFVLDKLLSN